MATKKVAVNQSLVKAFENAKPKNPALTGADKAFLRGLKRRGFTLEEIKAIAGESGFIVPDDLFEIKKRKIQP